MQKGKLMKLSKEYRVAVPKEFYIDLGFKVGDHVLIYKDTNKIVIHKTKVTLVE